MAEAIATASSHQARLDRRPVDPRGGPIEPDVKDEGQVEVVAELLDVL